MENNQRQQEANFLEDIELQLVQASGGKRFANFLIDTILSNLAYNFLEGFFTEMLTEPDEVYGEIWYAYIIGTLIFSLLFNMMYMFVNEYFMKGKSIGKLVTGTRAVNQDGTQISVRTALMRSLIRLIPFEVLSALGTPSFPWHDKWTDTYVIDEKKSNYELRISE